MDFDAIKSRISAIAQSGVAKAKDLTESGVAKAKDLTEIAKLKVSNASEQEAIRKAYMEIGRIYFAQHGDEPDPAFASLCAQIAEHKEKIAYNDERITDIKLSDGITDADIEAMETEIPLEDAVENAVVSAAEVVADAVEGVEGFVGDAIEQSLETPLE